MYLNLATALLMVPDCLMWWMSYSMLGPILKCLCSLVFRLYLECMDPFLWFMASIKWQEVERSEPCKLCQVSFRKNMVWTSNFQLSNFQLSGKELLCIQYADNIECSNDEILFHLFYLWELILYLLLCVFADNIMESLKKIFLNLSSLSNLITSNSNRHILKFVKPSAILDNVSKDLKLKKNARQNENLLHHEHDELSTEGW